VTLLLVTACSVDEVEILLRLEQVDIVDLKNVREDESLGCPTLDLIEYAIKIRPRGKLVSVPIGDLQTYTSNVRLCVQVLDRLGVDFVKIGLAVKSADSVNKILKAVREVSMSCKIVPACFADWKVYKLVSPLYVLEQTRKLDFEYFMIEPWVTMVRTTQKKQDDLAVCFGLIENILSFFCEILSSFF